MKRHDTKPYVNARVTDKSGFPVDLTSCTAKFIMTSDISGAPKVDAAAEIMSPATDGRLRYQWAIGDTDTPGIYFAEFEVTFQDSSKITLPNDNCFTVTIAEDYNNS